MLDQTTDLLSSCVVDDVHLSYHTAALVKMIAGNLRKSFLRIQAPTGESREQSRHHTPHGQENGAAVDQQLDHSGHQNSSFPGSNGQTREDVLAGIQAQTMTDLSQFTFMPPPNYDIYMQNSGDLNNNTNFEINQSLTDGQYHDWFALPLDNFFSNPTGSVDQGFGGIGPTVGNRDMLEVITNEHYDRWLPDMSGFSDTFQ